MAATKAWEERSGGMERLSAAVDEYEQYALSLGADRICGGLATTYQLSSLGTTSKLNDYYYGVSTFA